MNDGRTDEEFMTTEDAAQYLGVTRQRVQQLVVRDVIAARKYGKAYLLEAGSVQSYERSRKKAGRPAKK